MQARLDRDTIYFGTQTLLVVDVTDVATADWPVVAPVTGLTIERYGRPNVMRDLLRGTVQLSFRFSVSPERVGVFEIASVSLDAGGQKLSQGPFTLRVVEAPLAFLQIQVEPETLLMNEQARLNVVYQGCRAGVWPVVPDVPGLSIRQAGAPQVELMRQTGMPVTIYPYHVTALQLGRYTIKGITLDGVAAEPVTLNVSSFVVMGARVGTNSLVVGGQTTVQVVIRGLPPSSRPQLVVPPGAEARLTAPPSAARTGALIYTYDVTATEPGMPTISTVALPDGQRVSLPEPVKLSVRQEGEGGILACRGMPRSAETVIGEPLIIDYEVYFRGDLSGAGIDPSGAAFANEPHIKVEPVDDLSYPDWTGERIRVGFGGSQAIILSGNGEFNGRKEQLLRFALKVTPLAAGELSLDGLKVVLNIQARREQRTANGFFSTSYTQTYDRLAEVPAHQVIDPPGVSTPPGYRGAVGTAFTFATELDRTRATAMSPLTLTMKITGDTVGPEFKPPLLVNVPELVRDFDVSSTIGGGEVTGDTITFTQVIRPRNEAVTELPALPLAYYDSQKKRYSTAYSLPIPIEVMPGRLVGAEAMEVAVRPVESEAAKGNPDGQKAGLPLAALGANFTVLGDVAVPAPLSLAGVIAVLAAGPGSVLVLRAGQLVYRRQRPVSRVRQQRRRLRAALAGSVGADSFHVALAGVLQDYLRLTFDLPPGEISAETLHRAFERRSIDGGLQQEIQQLLGECDAGRFAAGAVARTERERLVEQTRRVFERLDRV